MPFFALYTQRNVDPPNFWHSMSIYFVSCQFFKWISNLPCQMDQIWQHFDPPSEQKVYRKQWNYFILLFLAKFRNNFRNNFLPLKTPINKQNLCTHFLFNLKPMAQWCQEKLQIEREKNTSFYLIIIVYRLRATIIITICLFSSTTKKVKKNTWNYNYVTLVSIK